MKIAILTIFALLAHPTLTQETKHTTTADLCREDQTRWETELNKPSASWSSLANDVDSKTLVIRASEMNNCSKVDSARSQQYTQTVHLLFAIVFSRESDFLVRHHLLDQFYEEDEARTKQAVIP
jgi:hypothetical protein